MIVHRLRLGGGRLRVAAHRLELRDPVRRVLISTGRLTLAAVTAYLLTLWVTEGSVDLTGALTALLVVQASAYATLRMGVVRVGAVLIGVLVAVALSSWVGLTWWSLGAAIAVSLLLAAALRLREQALETPISAMLVLGVGGQEIAAERRDGRVPLTLQTLLRPEMLPSPSIRRLRALATRGTRASPPDPQS